MAPNKSWGYGSNKLNEEGQILVACDRAQESGYAPMIAMVDGLKGFSEEISVILPQEHKSRLALRAGSSWGLNSSKNSL